MLQMTWNPVDFPQAALSCVTNQSLWRPQSSFCAILWASEILLVSLKSVPTSSFLLIVSHLVLVPPGVWQ